MKKISASPSNRKPIILELKTRSLHLRPCESEVVEDGEADTVNVHAAREAGSCVVTSVEVDKPLDSVEEVYVSAIPSMFKGKKFTKLVTAEG